MADVTRAEFDALKARVDRLDGATPTKPTVTVAAIPGTGYVDLQWSVKNLNSPIVSYWVGRDSVDVDGSGPWETQELPGAHSRRFDKLIPGKSYMFHVDVKFENSTDEAIGTAVSVPLPLPGNGGPGEPPKPGASFLRPPGKRSGLSANLSVFKGGDTTLTTMDNNAVGIKYDGALSFNNRSSWGPVKNGVTTYGGWDDALIAEIVKIQKAGGFFVVSMPHAPESEGSSMNQKGARNLYRNQQIAMAAYWKMKGVDPEALIVRLGWEFNGGWYAWAGKNGGASVLTAALDNFKYNWKSRMPGTLFDLCSNMPTNPADGGTPYSWKDIWGNGWDIISIDQYDAYTGVKTQDDWENKMKDIHSVRGARTEATRLGCMWAIAECGNWHNSNGAYDNPFYWQAMAGEVAKGMSNLAYWNQYDDQGAPNNLFHDWAHNPRSLAKVKEILTGWKK